MKKVFSPEFKTKVALTALQGQETISRISSIHQVHSTQIMNWKNQAKEGLVKIFSGKKEKKHLEDQKLIEELYKIIGEREAELSWLKKKLLQFNSS